MKFKPPSNIGGFLFYLIFIDMKIILTENKLDALIEKYGIVKTIRNIGGYKNFDKIYPDYFYSRDDNSQMQMNRERVINFLNECVEVNYKRENETNIYLHDYWEDILYQEWDGEGDDENEYFSYESRIMSISTDVANIEIWQYDEEGTMFDDAYDYNEIPLNRLETRFLSKIFEQLWGTFKL